MLFKALKTGFSLQATYSYGFEDEDSEEETSNQISNKECPKDPSKAVPGPSSEPSCVFKSVVDLASTKVNINPEYLSKGLAGFVTQVIPNAFESHLGIAGLDIDDKLIAILKFAFDKSRTNEFVALFSRDTEFTEYLNILNWNDSYTHPAIPKLRMPTFKTVERNNIKLGISNAVKSLRGLLLLSQVTFDSFKASPSFVNDIIIPPIVAGFDVLFDHIRRFRKISLEPVDCPRQLKLDIIDAPCLKIWNLNEEMIRELHKFKMRFRSIPSSWSRGRGGFRHRRSFRGSKFRFSFRSGFRGQRPQRGSRVRTRGVIPSNNQQQQS